MAAPQPQPPGPAAAAASAQPHLDAVRGACALVVAACHAAGAFLLRFAPAGGVADTITGILAAHAVLVFFLLSGHLVSTSLLRPLWRHGRLDPAAYLAARVARIYPPLLGASVVCLACGALIHGLHLPGSDRDFALPGDTQALRTRFQMAPAEIWLALTLRNGLLGVDGPLWSLCIEGLDYLLVLLVALAVSGRGLWLRIAAAAAAWAVVRHGLRVNTHFLFYTGIWALGAATALMRGRGGVARWRGGPRADLVAMAALVLLLALGGRHAVLRPDALWTSRLVCLLLCLVWCHGLFHSARLERLRCHALEAAAGYSYTLYLVHFPLLLLMLAVTRDWMGRSLPRAAVVTVLAMGLVTLSARQLAAHLEQPQALRAWLLRQARRALP